MLRGKIINEWHELYSNSHYHLNILSDKKEFDISINIGFIKNMKIENLISSKLKIYYNENYSHEILSRMLNKKDYMVICDDDFYLDYVKLKMFKEDEIEEVLGYSSKERSIYSIIKNIVSKVIDNNNYEVYIFGNLYSSEKGIHDIHMNQGSANPYRNLDRAKSDGGFFVYDKSKNSWTALFIMFLTQTLQVDENIHAINKNKIIEKR